MRHALLLCLVVVLTAPCLAADTFVAEKKDSRSVQDAQNTLLAWQLLHYGRDTDNPMAMATAALMLRDIQPKFATLNTNAPKPVQILTEAASVARTQGNGPLVSLIEKWQKQGDGRGVTSGAVQHVATLSAGEVHRIALQFQPQQDAVLGLMSNSPGGMEVRLSPALPGTIKSALCRPSCQFVWTPEQSGRYELEIRHLGKGTAEYLMVTN